MDDLIDRALSAYVAAEPRPGLEERILAHATKPRRGWAPWLLAAAGLLFYVAQALSPVHPGGTGFQPVHEAEAKRQQAAVIARVSPPHRHHTPRRTRLPKGDIFPVITPIPEPELTLARLASSDPQLASSLLAEPATGEPAPITIEPLSIKSLDED